MIRLRAPIWCFMLLVIGPYVLILHSPFLHPWSSGLNLHKSCSIFHLMLIFFKLIHPVFKLFKCVQYLKDVNNILTVLSSDQFFLKNLSSLMKNNIRY